MVEVFSDTHKHNSTSIASVFCKECSPQATKQNTNDARLVTAAPFASCASYRQISFIRLPDVIKRVGLKRAAIYQHMALGKFPKQISLGSRAVGWLEHEIDAWLAARVEARRRSDEESV